MKFRCERDVLLEALATAGRAVATRGGALPVLSGVRLELRATPAPDRHRPRPHHPGRSDGRRQRRRRGRHPRPLGHRHRAGPRARRGARRRSRATRPSIAAGRSQFAVRLLPGRGVPPPARARAATRSPSTPRPSPRRCSQVVRAASSDDARPILTGVLMAAEGDGLRLVATDSYRLAVRDLPGTRCCGEGQTVLVPSRALGELERLLGQRRARSRCASASGGHLRGRRARGSPPA